MRKFFKRITSRFLIPLTRWYLRKERTYTYKGSTVSVLPGVFHPGLFHSTRFLLEFLREQPLGNKTLLELGCGCGLISIASNKMGAIVTASDVSLKAVENTKANAIKNTCNIEVIQSNLFENFQAREFDWIVINPPYYLGKAVDEADAAWYCGEDFDYFRRLFPILKKYVHSRSTVLIVLTKGAAVAEIQEIGNSHGVNFQLIREKNALFDEKDYLFRLLIKRLKKKLVMNISWLTSIACPIQAGISLRTFAS